MKNYLLKNLWAKTEPFHPLYSHMIDVGNVAAALLRTVDFQSVVPRFAEAAACSNEQATNVLVYLSALHDIGKCHVDFQTKGPEELTKPLLEAGLVVRQINTRFRHEAMSGKWLMSYLFTNLGWDRRAAVTVSAALRGHHGNFREDDPPEEIDNLLIWEELRCDLEQIIRNTFNPENWRLKFIDHSNAGILLSGLVVLSDWIASNRELFIINYQDMEYQSYAELSYIVALKAVEKLGFSFNKNSDYHSYFREIWPTFEDLRPIQARCEELSLNGLKPGLAILEAPMGEGKTEAAIYLATQWQREGNQGGIYFALPTAATSNQMYGRFKSFLEKHDQGKAEKVQLVHGMSWLLDDDTPLQKPEIDYDSPIEKDLALEWFRPKKRSLLAAYGVGTIDQALMSILHVRHGFLRLFGLSGKVIIIDEVHAYDAYMSELLTLLLQWCGNLKIPVILLSATLPERKRTALMEAYLQRKDSVSIHHTLAPYPLLTLVDYEGNVREEAVSGSSKRMTLNLVKHFGLLKDPCGIAALVVEKVEKGGCFCVIANTIDAAQKIFLEIKKLLEKQNKQGVELFLFHARYTAEKRMVIEEKILGLFDKNSLLPLGNPKRKDRPVKAILVATQVVEQSLDLDFDEMFTEIAPIDLLLQRAGRLHRHNRLCRPTGEKAQLHILLPAERSTDFGFTEKVYSRYILLKTLLVLEKIEVIELPKEIRNVIEMVYDYSYDTKNDSELVGPEELKKAFESFKTEIQDDAGKAERFLIPSPYKKGFKLARTSHFPFKEGEEEPTSYFNAKTRLGNESKRVFIVEEGLYPQIMAGDMLKDKEKTKKLFQKTVNIPGWWLKEVEAESGYYPPQQVDLLRGATMLFLKRRIWKGRNVATGKKFSIVDHPELGLIRKEEGEE
jgi:CRISPR-associated endonuclease/helicase Cas3